MNRDNQLQIGSIQVRVALKSTFKPEMPAVQAECVMLTGLSNHHGRCASD